MGAGTRILMFTGIYKNIEDIKIGDKVINKNGNIVNVLNMKNSGIKKVLQYKTNAFYKSTLATPDHNHWVGDYSTTPNVLNNGSICKTLDLLTKKDESKYKWQRLDQTQNSICLLPNKIEFELPQDFLISFKDYYVKEKNFDKSECNNEIKPSYGLGYLFGTFLGDGCSKISTYHKSMRGSISWYFGLNELDIAQKVVKYIKEIFNLTASIQEKNNILQVNFYSLPAAKLFSEMGKQENNIFQINIIVQIKIIY